jgi:hypothetical protein
MAGPPSAAYRLKKFAARHRVAVAAAAGLFLATAAFGAVMAWQAQQLARERDEARFQAPPQPAKTRHRSPPHPPRPRPPPPPATRSPAANTW